MVIYRVEATHDDDVGKAINELDYFNPQSNEER